MKLLKILLVLFFISANAQQKFVYETNYEFSSGKFDKEKVIFGYDDINNKMNITFENPKYTMSFIKPDPNENSERKIILTKEDYSNDKRYYIMCYATDRKNMLATNKLFEDIQDYYFFFDKKQGTLLKVLVTFSEIRRGVESKMYFSHREFFTETGKKVYENLF